MVGLHFVFFSPTYGSEITKLLFMSDTLGFLLILILLCHFIVLSEPAKRIEYDLTGIYEIEKYSLQVRNVNVIQNINYLLTYFLWLFQRILSNEHYCCMLTIGGNISCNTGISCQIQRDDTYLQWTWYQSHSNVVIIYDFPMFHLCFCSLLSVYSGEILLCNPRTQCLNVTKPPYVNVRNIKMTREKKKEKLVFFCLTWGTSPLFIWA